MLKQNLATSVCGACLLLAAAPTIVQAQASQAGPNQISAGPPQGLPAGTPGTAPAGTPTTTQSTQTAIGPAPASNSLAEVVVTARKRSENIEKVPISLAAVTGATIAQEGVHDLKDFSNFVPGLDINSGRADGGGTATQIYIRGVGQNDFLIPNEPGVGLYVDDVYVASSSGAIDSLGDVQSVEVLRGPQGTLYGKNTIGGAIRITTVQPVLGQFSGSADVIGGSYGRHDFTGGLNIPLGDTAALRIYATSRQTDDLQRRYLEPSNDGQGNINEDATRALLRWRPNNKLDITLSGDFTYIRQHQPYGGNIGYAPGASPLIDALNAQYFPTINRKLGLPANAQFNSQWATAPGPVGATGPNSDNYNVWGVSAVVNYELTPQISAKSITAVRGVEGYAGRDGDSSPYAILETTSYDHNYQYSQEIQINGTSFQRRLKWTTGFYYMRMNADNHIVSKLWDGLIDTSVNTDFDAYSNSHETGDSIALYGQATYDITPKLHLTAGERYSVEIRDFTEDWYFLQQPRSYTCPGVDFSGRFINCNSTDHVSTPAASLAYDITRNAMAYFSYSEGFKVGGWTPRLFSQQSLKRYLPERLTAYEWGLKTQWFEHRLTFNIDAFQSDYSDLQLTSVQADSTGAPQPIVENAGQARIRGIESDLSARLPAGFTAQAGLSYLDGEYLKLSPGVSFPLNAQLPDTPKFSVTAALEKRWDMANGDNLLLRVDGAYRSTAYKDPSDSPQIAQKPYGLMNARASYTLTNSRITLSLFGTNLTDTRYIVDGLNVASTFGEYEAYYGRPREYGGEISYKF